MDSAYHRAIPKTSGRKALAEEKAAALFQMFLYCMMIGQICHVFQGTTSYK